MAKKTSAITTKTKTKATSAPTELASTAGVVATTAVRNSAVPPKTTTVAARKTVEITGDRIAIRAFEIFASGRGGSEQDNWFQAERELRSGL